MPPALKFLTPLEQNPTMPNENLSLNRRNPHRQNDFRNASTEFAVLFSAKHVRLVKKSGLFCGFSVAANKISAAQHEKSAASMRMSVTQ
jgi:hypothetical protein